MRHRETNRDPMRHTHKGKQREKADRNDDTADASGMYKDLICANKDKLKL